MALHVIFIDKDGQQLSDVISNFTSVSIPQNAFIMRIADDTKSYSNSTLTKLFEIDNTFYSKVLEYTLKGDYQVIDVSVQDFSGFTAIFNQLSAQFVGNNPPTDIYDFTGYGGSGSGGNIDFSTIVTALNSIATALSSLTNLSNLSNLSQLVNIISAIQNKDNQSNLVNCLNLLFSYKADLNGTKRRSVFNGFSLDLYDSNYSDRPNQSICGLLDRISSLLYFDNFSGVADNRTLYNTDKFLYSLKSVSSNLGNIETKLEQNLPFTTVVENDIVETNVAQNCSYGSKIEQIPFSE